MARDFSSELFDTGQNGTDFSAELFAEKPKAPSGYLQGLGDPIDALAQTMTHILPQPIVSGVNKFNNWLADKGVPVDRIPEGGMDQAIAQKEQEYQAQRQAAGETGFDWGRLAGNVANPVNLALMSRLPAGMTLANRMKAGAGVGAGAAALLQPVTQGEYAPEKAKQMVLGAATGGILPAITSGVSRVISPRSSPEVQMLMDRGVTPTPGQVLGGLAKSTEEKMTSLPLVGDAIKAGQRRAINQFNIATINEALKPIATKLPKDMQPGREAIVYAGDAISNAYETLLPKLTGRLDNKFLSDIAGIRNLAQNMPKERADQLERILQNEVFNRFTAPNKGMSGGLPATGAAIHGLASGETIKNIESKLGQMVKGYMNSNDYDSRILGSAIREVQDSLREMIKRNNPNYKGMLGRINSSFAKMKRVERASSFVGAENGIFTPNQLNTAVKALDITKGKRGFSRGEALTQDLSSAGKTVLSNKYPDSGTAGRMLLDLGAIGAGAYVHPGSLVAAGTASLPYTPIGQRALANLLARRPEGAGLLADLLRRDTPFLIPGANAANQGLLNQ